METRQCQKAAGSFNHHAAWHAALRRRVSPQALLHQEPHGKARVAAQVAAVPTPFTDDSRAYRQPGIQAAVTVQQQQQLLQQQNGWLPQPWSSKGQQQQQAGNSWQQQVQSPAAQQEPHQQQQQDPLLRQLQDCQHWTQVAAVVQQQQQQQQGLSFSYVIAALQQLSSCVQPKALPQQHQQQLDMLLTTLADAAIVHLQDLHHQEVGELLARLQVLGFKPSVNWAKSVLQHAGTELVHYTPAELALLLLTATQTAARVAGSAPPPMQLTRSSPTAAPSMLMGAQPSAADLLPYAADPLPYAADPLQYACPPPEIDLAAVAQPGSRSGSSSSSITARRAPTVLTTAWLQHFMMTFERYLAARAAHPQLQLQHMEAVITCLAALRVTPDRFWLYLFVRQMTAQLPACPPGSVVRMLSALARMGYRLPEHVISQIERQVGGAALAALRPQECVEVVRSVAALKQRPSEAWLQQLLAAAVKGSSHLSSSAAVSLVVACAGLGMQLDSSWIDVLLLQARAALHVLSAPEHVGLIDALSQQQHRPGPVFMSLFMAQVQGHFPELTLGQQAVLVASLAAVGYKPAPAWMTAFMGQLAGQRVTAADAPELLRLLVALRRMQYTPSPAVGSQIEGLIDSMAVNVTYGQLQQLRGALAELQYKPTVAAAAMGSVRGVRERSRAAPAAAAPSAGVAAEVAQSATSAAATVAAAVSAEVNAADQVQEQAAAAAAAPSSEEQQQEVLSRPPAVMESLELLA